MIRVISIFIIAFSIFSQSVMADLRQYNARLENSVWSITTASKLQCTLSHAIPRYGDALFTTYASRELNLEFELDMLRLPSHYDVAEVFSVAPPWRAGVKSRLLSNMKILKQFNGELPQNTAWEMLTELEKGMQPTLYYADWGNPNDKVAVSLSSVNFHKPYENFLHCIDELLPYSFDDIAFTILNYKQNSSQLTKESSKRLEMIGAYLKAAPELDLVLVTAFTDSYGGRYHNEQLSIKRAESIKTFFTEQGVEADRVSTQGYGEKRHIDTNKNILGRSKNRRVVIQLERSL